MILAAVVLLVLWAVGSAEGFTLHGGIHVLLAAAVLAIVVRAIQGRQRAGVEPAAGETQISD